MYFRQALVVLLLSCFFVVNSQRVTPPKLIVFVVIDELDNNQLNFLQSKFTLKGFNRIAQEGHRYMSMVSTDFSSYPGTRMSTLFTGTHPATHGVVSSQWVDYQKRNSGLSPCLVSSNVGAALKNGQAHSLADYLKLYYGKRSISMGFALDAPWMVYSLGSMPNHFYLFNSLEGAFYDALSDSTKVSLWLSEFNNRMPHKSLIQREWQPLRSLSEYTEYKGVNVAEHRKFSYKMKGERSAPYDKIASSPVGNTLLRDVVVAALANSELGKDDVPDLLTLCFTSRPFVNTPKLWLPAEKEDMLLRIDQDIASLIDFLDFEIGNDNYIIAVTSASSSAEVGEVMQGDRVVESKKIESLLNLYLMAIHGQGKWVLGISDHQVFLNRHLIEKENVPLNVIQQEAALFVMEMAGVARVIPTYEMMLMPPNEEPFKSNFYPMRTGDLYYTLKPGWVAKQSDNSSSQFSANGSELMPFLMRGWKIPPGVTVEKCNMIGVVPHLLELMDLSVSDFREKW